MAHWESSLMVTYREQGRVETSCCLQQTEVSTIQINHQPDATIFQFIILTFIYSSVSDCQTRLLNVFGQIAMYWVIK
jgi:hypothetical protein